MQPWNFFERRKLPRYELKLCSRTVNPQTCQEVSSLTHDVSEQGLGIIANERLPLNMPLKISLIMPDDGESITVNGKVMWLAPADKTCFRAGILLDASYLKPIPMVLRMIKTQLKSRYY